MKSYYIVEYVNDGETEGWRSVKITDQPRITYKFLSNAVHKSPARALGEISKDVSINPDNLEYFQVEVKSGKI